MAEKSTAKKALEKLNSKLECSICLTDYTDPKLLPCFHVFCMQCLEPLVIQDHDGLSLQCPICRHSTKLPPKGVAGLQSDFHVEHLFEIRDAFEKTTPDQTAQKTKCEKCEDDNATGFCRDCGEFICDACTTLHRKWKQFKSHEMVSLEEVQTEATNLIRPKKQVSYCPRHQENVLKIFCETCSELICIDCTIKLHQGHNYDLVADVFSKHKDEMVASLQPVKEQLSTVNKAFHAFEERVREIEEQKMTIEAAVNKEINSLQQLLEQRRTQLISKLDHLSQLKLKALASQRDQVELVQVKLSSCVDYVEGGLKTGTEGEVLAMKAPVMKRIEKITADFKPATLQPEEANLELIASNKRDLQQACKVFGDVGIQQVSPENSYASGEGLERATVGEQAVAMVTAMSVTNREFTHQTNLTAELVHCKSKSIIPTEVQNEQNSRYKITYQPTKRGKHQLSVKINGREIKDSPFTIAVTPSPQSLGRPVRVIGNLKGPYFVTTNSQNQIIVAENSSHCVSVFSPEGKKIHSFGSEGRNDGQFIVPRGVTVDNVSNIYVADRDNHRIQKFTSEGKFHQSVGTRGSGQLQFYSPMKVSFNPNNQKLYVCDQGNDRIQVLNSDLTFHSTIGRGGTGNGEFKYTADIAFNSKGDIYVTDCNNDRVQIFNQDGTFSRTLTNKQQGEALNIPYGIAVDSSDTVYVSERDRGCISVFTVEGEYLTSFGGNLKGKAEGQFDCPRGLHVDKNDSLFVCDTDNGRIQIF